MLQGLVDRRWGRMFAAACVLLAAGLLLRDQTSNTFDGRERVNIDLGLWASRFLVAALALSPLSMALRRPALKQWRRPLGLAATAFALIHVVQWLAYSGVWPGHLNRVLRRPYLIVGIASILLLAAMALTSHRAVVRLFGPKRWKRLHRAVYPAAMLMSAHALMGGAAFLGEAGVHAGLVAGLLLARLAVRGQGAAVPRRSTLGWANTPEKA